MPESPSKFEEPQADISTQIVELTDFDPTALTEVIRGAKLDHKRLPGGDSAISSLQGNLPHSVFNRATCSPAIVADGTFAANAITISTMVRQSEPAIVNGSRVPTGTVLFYPEKAEVCYRGFPMATWFAFVIPRERLHAFCADNLNEIPVLSNSNISTLEPSQKARLPQRRQHASSLGVSYLGFGGHQIGSQRAVGNTDITSRSHETSVLPVIRQRTFARSAVSSVPPVQNTLATSSCTLKSVPVFEKHSRRLIAAGVRGKWGSLTSLRRPR